MHHRAQTLERETRRSAVILGLSAAIAAGTMVAIPWLRQPVRDTATGCRPGSLARKTIILVDRTDPWTPGTASLIVASVKRIAEEAATEERLKLLTFDGSAAALPKPLFDRCRPPTTGNIVIETPQRLAKIHAEQFAAPLLAAIHHLSQPSSAERTELVQFLAVLAAHARLDTPAEVTTLHVFSDMDENSAAFSFAKRPAQSLDLFAAHFAASIGERLKHVSLHVHVLPPPSGTTRADSRIERAWRAAFTRHAVQLTWGSL